MPSESALAPARVSARLIFDPRPTPDGGAPVDQSGGREAAGAASGWRTVPAWFLSFYRDRVAWLALGVTSVTLAYVGGLIMFWFHAVELGESGPAISWYFHWLLDSTVGFLALTPAIALIIPLAAWVSVSLAGPTRTRILPWLYAIVAGGLFSVITTPGPIAHDTFVGRGTWLADHVTALLGDPDAPLAPSTDYGIAAALTQQLGAGIAVYLALTALSVLVVRLVVARSKRAGMRVRSDGGRVTIDR